jgi:L-ectoine synthase
MIVRQLQELIGTDRDVHAETFVSRRLLLARDGQSFSMHDTIIKAGTETYMWYKNHIEAVYCVGGEGELENAQTREIFPIRDGTFYCLNEHDKHVLRAKTDLRMICVFTPPLVGPETHDQEGVYPLLTDASERAATA